MLAAETWLETLSWHFLSCSSCLHYTHPLVSLLTQIDEALSYLLFALLKVCVTVRFKGFFTEVDGAGLPHHVHSVDFVVC